MSDHRDDYLGAEGDVHARGTGLNWLQEGRLEQLIDLLECKGTDSAQTCLAVLDVLAKDGPLPHIELANRVRCTPAELRSRNGRMTRLIRHEFAGYRWPIGWQRGDASSGGIRDAYVYEMHPDVIEAWRELRLLG